MSNKGKLKVFTKEVEVYDQNADGWLTLSVKDEGAGRFVEIQAQGMFAFESKADIQQFAETVASLLEE